MDEAKLERFQGLLDISPFQRWLGVQLESVDDQRLVLGLDWRDEFVSNPQNQSMHGGILAALIDLGGLYAILGAGGGAVATVDLRVDYHRPASQERLTATSTVIKLGTKVSSAQTEIAGAERQLVASGRGVYLMRG